MSEHPILLLDVMDTIVYDPYRREIPAFFGLNLRELAELKHPTAWQEFERDEIGEQTFFDKYFEGSREVDTDAFREHLRGAYRFVDGMEELLERLHERHPAIHALSNYPVWWKIIEQELELSRFLEWSFVSCMTGLRKPDPNVYRHVVDQLSVEPDDCLFVDDREQNCRAARQVGLPAVRFEDARQLEEELIGP